MNTTEAYTLFKRIKNGETALGFFFLDAVCYCIFDIYDEGAEGIEQRNKIRRHRPSIYDELEACGSQEAFDAIIAQMKLEGIN